jgi:hypothetical protein
MEKAYRNLGYFFLLLIPLVFAAFYKSYIVKFPSFGANYDYRIHIHAFFASVWVFILIVQPFLIVNKKMQWHRAVGKLTYIIFPLLILSFIPGIMKSVNKGDFNNIFFPLADCTLLILFYSLAIYNKKTAAKHMRFMIASALVLFGPTIGRILPHLGLSDFVSQNIQYGITYLVLGSLIVYDINNKRKYRPYMVALTGFIVHQLIYLWIFL